LAEAFVSTEARILR